MSRSFVMTAAVALGLFTQGRADARPKHPELHRAIYEMHEARKELINSPKGLGGHKQKAIDALHAAVTQTMKALESVGDPFQGFSPDNNDYTKYKDYQHLRHCLPSLQHARTSLLEAPHTFNGHKNKA